MKPDIQPSPVCPLHSELKPYLGYCFYKAAEQIRARVDAQLEPFGIVAPQFGMLIVLQAHGSKTQGELCQSMNIDKATMVRMIDGLETLRYVTRLPSDEDRRANRLELTKIGRVAITKMDQARKMGENQFLAPLSLDERRQLIAIISKLSF